MNDYPDELRHFPSPVIAFVGSPSLHSAITKNLSTRKDLYGQEVSYYHILSFDAAGPSLFPDRKKERRQTYEGYIPNGILKADWMNKHRKLIPSLILLFYVWDEDKNWRNKENDMCNELEMLRKNSKSRNNKLLIVLVQQRQTSDQSLEERLNSFKKRADVDSKNIIFIDRDNLAESVKKLDKLLIEVSKTFYKDEGRRIKKDYQKSNLAKGTQQILTVRHHFKIAYYAEFRRDNRTTLKYYQSAYNMLREICLAEMKTTEKLRMSEIKTVADYINFQICKLYLSLGNLSEAINQFHKHVKTYLIAIGQTEVEFEHWAWVSRQYHVFAQLLELLAANSLQSMSKYSIQHPGFYYQAAAKYAMERKKHAKRLCETLRKSSTLDKINKDALELFRPASIDVSSMTYIGQQPQYDLMHPLAQAEHHKEIETDNTLKCLARELLVDHSSLIIELLSKAYEHFKGPSSNRMTLYIASQMAQEYYESERYAMAKKFFDRVAASYRREGWWILLTNILNVVLKCALQLGLVQDYIDYALELLAECKGLVVEMNHHSDMYNSPEEKNQIQASIVNILSNPSSISVATIEAPIVKSMEYNHPLSIKHYPCGAYRFTPSFVYAKSRLTFLVQLVTRFPLAIRFSRLTIEFSDSSYNTEIRDTRPITDTTTTEDTQQTDNMLFFPEKSRVFTFHFISKEKMELKCTKLCVELGSGQSSIWFQWNVLEWPPEVVVTEQEKDPNYFYLRPATKILEHEAKLDISVEHVLPALVNEFFQVVIKLRNMGEPIVKGRMVLDIAPSKESQYFFATADTGQPIKEIPLPAIDPGTDWAHTVYMFATCEEQHKVTVKVIYETEASYSTVSEKVFPVAVQFPFSPQFNLFSPQFHPLVASSGSIVVNEPFFVYVDIHCVTPFPLELLKSKLLLPSYNKLPGTICQTSSDVQKPFVLHKENRATIWYELVPSVSGENVDLGAVELSWKRVEQHAGGPTTSVITIPSMKISTAPFSAKIDVPPFAVVGSVTPFSVLIHNHTEQLQEFALTVTENNAFLFAGEKHSSFCIHPHSSYTLRHNLIPLTAGRQLLPHFQITSKRLSAELIQTKQSRYIFISPSKI